MHRRTLIMRRFGEMSFGLGYVEDGVWVDHAIAVARGEDLLATRIRGRSRGARRHPRLVRLLRRRHDHRS